MKTEITIDGITYKVGDVLEHPNSKHLDHKILAITGRSVFVSYKVTSEGVSMYYDALIDIPYLKHWRIKKPKKKLVVECWLNIYENGDVIKHYTKNSADAHAREDRIVCEHFYKEYEIDDD